MSILLEAFGVLSGAVGIHSWVASSKNKKELDERFKKLESGIYILTNQVDHMSKQMSNIDSSIHSIRPLVESIQDAMHTYIGLVAPVPLDKQRSALFRDVLFKYIPQQVVNLEDLSKKKRKTKYRIQLDHVPMLWTTDGGKPQMGIVPTNFLKDYFGIEVLLDREKKLLNIREDSLRRTNTNLSMSTKSNELVEVYHTSTQTQNAKSRVFRPADNKFRGALARSLRHDPRNVKWMDHLKGKYN